MGQAWAQKPPMHMIQSPVPYDAYTILDKVQNWHFNFGTPCKNGLWHTVNVMQQHKMRTGPGMWPSQVNTPSLDYTGPDNFIPV